MNPTAEWLEADGSGGFASGTVSGVRTRRYHALQVAASRPPAGRYVLASGFDAWIELRGERHPISSQRYTPDVLSPDGSGALESFEPEPWPRWTYRVGGGLRVRQELFMAQGAQATVLTWSAPEGRLGVQPFLSGREFHALHHRNPAFRFEPDRAGEAYVWRPYPGIPPLRVTTNGTYVHAPSWYYNFQYDQERARGLDFVEDLASPGTFTWDLGRGEATLVLSTREAVEHPAILRERERERRKAFSSPLERAGDAYLVNGRRGRTIVAGYPWFADWGRDTFVSLRGLCHSTGRSGDALEILLSWAEAVDQGMLPNRFPEEGEAPEFNSVDASLFYVLAVQEYLRLFRCAPSEASRLNGTVESILDAYARGTRHGIGVRPDGLLGAGESGLQLTWMDARVGERVVTPRMGAPVEIQGLWLGALGAQGPRWETLHARGLETFRARFWNAALDGLYDVVEDGGVPGRVDPAFRPNQVLAAGHLDPERAGRLLQSVESRLLTPAGLRSLAPGEPGYRGRYEGGPAMRDEAYHQGTVWPWLMGPFVDLWIRLRGDSAAARSEARERFVKPLLERTQVFGLGHLFEIADGDAPHAPRGCPFQAWSTGELLRLDRLTR